MKEECVFCQIVAGDSPASLFYEDEVVLGIMDTGPVTKGHAMIIPRNHVARLSDLDEETGRCMFAVAHRTGLALYESGLKCEGVNFFLADGEAAFQEVFHIHLHVFPRYEGDPFKLVADWSSRPPREELDAVAAQIRSAYEGLHRAR